MGNREDVNWYRGRLPKNGDENPTPLVNVDFLPSKHNELHLGEIEEGQDRVFVRVMTFDKDNDNQEADINRTVIERARIGNALFKELADDYHVRLPKMQFVVGKDKNNKSAVFVLANRVEGHNLSELIDETDIASLSAPDKKRLISELDDLIVSLGNYYYDIVKSVESGKEKEHLWDVDGFSQYIFGRQKGDSVSHIYLIDLDPLFEKVDLWRGFTDAVIYIGVFLVRIPYCEERFGGRLLKSRQRFLEIISELKPLLLKERPFITDSIRRQLLMKLDRWQNLLSR
ncbi:MAG: hypothetical protein WCT16_04895 [Candidatus Buchananbacteria bacterium]